MMMSFLLCQSLCCFMGPDDDDDDDLHSLQPTISYFPIDQSY